MRRLMRRLFGQRGQAMLEYFLIVLGVGILCAGVALGFGGAVKTNIRGAAGCLNSGTTVTSGGAVEC